MEKLQRLQLMDKVLREIEDLQNSQASVLKKIAQIEADNITLGVGMLEKTLPDLHEEVDSSLTIVIELLQQFQQHRDKYVVENNLVVSLNPQDELIS